MTRNAPIAIALPASAAAARAASEALRFRFLAPLLVTIALLGAVAASAQVSGEVAAPAATSLQVFVYTLRHQPANEALIVVSPLLSPRGRVEIQPEEGNIVVHDTRAVLDRVAPALQKFDHPLAALDLEVKIIQAGPVSVGGVPSGLHRVVLQQLHSIYRYESYQLLAGINLREQEGVEVRHQVGQEYVVTFRIGTILEDSRVRLSGFRVSRVTADPQARPLLATTLTPWLGQTLVLGLTQTEGDDSALLVAVTCRKARTGAPGAR